MFSTEKCTHKSIGDDMTSSSSAKYNISLHCNKSTIKLNAGVPMSDTVLVDLNYGPSHLTDTTVV